MHSHDGHNLFFVFTKFVLYFIPEGSKIFNIFSVFFTDKTHNGMFVDQKWKCMFVNFSKVVLSLTIFVSLQFGNKIHSLWQQCHQFSDNASGWSTLNGKKEREWIDIQRQNNIFSLYVGWHYGQQINIYLHAYWHTTKCYFFRMKNSISKWKIETY